jgi:hypothetical protein
MVLKPSCELAYWVGVAQTDGSVKKRIYFDGSQNRKKYLVRIEFGVSKRSLLMLKRFKEISKKILMRDNKIFFNKRCQYNFYLGIKSFSQDLHRLDISFSDPPTPPFWCILDVSFFGAYLAGVIDGDGSVRISYRKYPQCQIRISSGFPQDDLKKAIALVFNSSAWIIKKKERVSLVEGRRILNRNDWVLEFTFNKKNKDLFLEYVLPWVQIKHKKEKLEKFSVLKRWSGD